MPTGSRPFGAATLASAMQLDDHAKASEAIKIAEVRFQGVVIAIRTWKSGRANPLNILNLALQARTLDENLMRELEADNACP
jgi:hypothetical protein